MSVIYLAGPIEMVEDGGVEWRQEAAKMARPGTRLIDPTHFDGSKDHGLTAQEIVTRDKFLLRQSHGAIFDARSTSAGWGTAMELLDAYQMGMPTVGWGAPTRKSAFLEHHCTRFFDTLEEAMEYMQDLLEKAGVS